MSDLLTTLHPINDDTTDLYPNVKRDNLPQNVKAELDAIPNKVDKVQGKGLSTNDFTNADKALVDTIPDKVDKVTGKGLSTNDYTNADKSLVDTIPDKVNKEQGKGLSTNDYTNADKNAVEVAIPLKLSFLNTNILDLYRMVIRSGGLITVTDASVALTSQPFPLTVSPKALLDYVGGMCQKVNQLVPNGDMSSSSGWGSWYYGGSVSFSNGVVTVSKENGTCDLSRLLNNTIPSGHKVLFVARLKTSNSNNVVFGGSNNQYTGSIASSTSFSIVSAIKDLSGDLLRVYIACISENADCEMNVDWFNIADLSVIYPTDTPTSTSDPRIQRLISYLSSHPEYNEGSIITAPVTTVVSKGSTNIYYPIHRDIRALDGYGWGINNECYNYIDFERKVFVKKVARVDLGEITFTYNSPYWTSNAIASLVKIPSTNIEMPSIVAAKYTKKPRNAMDNNGEITIDPNTGILRIRDEEENTPSGILFYELATPVETDISDLLVLTFPTYDIINVLPGGYLEFENENNIGVPYSVTYQSKPDAQTAVRTIAPTAISEVDSNDPTNPL